MKTFLLSVGIALLILGAVFTFLPHQTHNSLVGYFVHQHSSEHAYEEHGSHDLHQNTGIIIAVAGILLAAIGYRMRKNLPPCCQNK